MTYDLDCDRHVTVVAIISSARSGHTGKCTVIRVTNRYQEGHLFVVKQAPGLADCGEGVGGPAPVRKKSRHA